MKYDYTVYIGRFQPFHMGHLASVKEALTESRQLIMVLGSANVAPNTKNPFTADEREEMILRCLSFDERERVQFVRVRDYLYDDSKWVTEVQNVVNEITGYEGRVALIGYHKDESSYYLDLFPNWNFIHATPKRIYDATTVRELLFTSQGYAHLLPEAIAYYLSEWQKNSLNYVNLLEEHKYLRAYKESWKGPYAPVFVTADMVVMQNNHVLVVKRGGNPGKGLYAMPGGFVGPNERIAEAAFRELQEETCILAPNEVLREGLRDTRVFDHPGRSLRGRTITHAYFIQLKEPLIPRVHGADDAAKAQWMPIIDVYKNENRFFEDHFQIVDYFVSRR